MLSDEVLAKVIARLTNRIEQANTYTLEQIGKAIKKIGKLSPTQAHQLGQLLKYGGDYNKITKRLSEITQLNKKDIQKIFDEVAKSDYQYAKQFYDYRGKNFIPYENNSALRLQVQALANITANEYQNFANTLAFTQRVDGKLVNTPLARVYQETIDKAILSISQGTDTFEHEMYSVIKELSESGLKTIDYASGRSVRLDSAVESHMRGALRNMHNEVQEIIGKEYGADGIEVSVHLNPAPDHEFVQGKQFSKEEFNKFQNDMDAVSYDGELFPAISEETGHDRRAISQYNCYHTIFEIILGVSRPAYSDEELKAIIEDNHKGFEFKGKHYTKYEGTQLQRRIETEIRKQKDMQMMGKASGNVEAVGQAQRNIKMLSDKYNWLSDISELPTAKERLRVSDYKRVITSPNYMNIDVTKDRDLYARIKNEKQIYHSTDTLKEMFESKTADINLQVLNKNKRPMNYGYEGIYLKPEALNYSTKLYNGDRGNNFTARREEMLRERNIYSFIDKAGEEHIYSTSIVKKLPVLENTEAIVTYKSSPNYDYLKELAKKHKIKLIEYKKF